MKKKIKNLVVYVFLGVLIAQLFLPEIAKASLGSWPDTSYVIGFDGPVKAMATNGTTLYVGGDFNNAYNSIRVNGSLAVNKISGIQSVNMPDVNVGGGLNVSIADGSGGWYVGGVFTQIGGKNRNNLAHILPNGSIDPSFNPNISGDVNALVLNGGTLYVGGYFDKVNGNITRNNVAAVSAATGTVTSFNPNVEYNFSPGVMSLLLNGNILYVGGMFEVVNGNVSRNGFAAFDTVTGTVTSFNPDLQNSGYITPVKTMLLSGTTLYLSGSFTKVNGNVDRNYLAAFDTTTTGTVTAFDPGPNGQAFSLILDGTTLYISGSFTSVNYGATTRHGIAAFDTTTTGTATTFDPDVMYDGGTAYMTVTSLLLDGTILYAGGQFQTVNGTSVIRNNMAAFDVTTTGVPLAFNPNIEGGIQSLSLYGNNVYVWGNITHANGVTRHKLAAIDLVSKTITNFNPDFGTSGSHRVLSLALDGSNLYVGGIFTTVNNGSVSRNNLAVFPFNSDTPTNFDIGLTQNNQVNSLVLDGTTLYVGGSFTAVNSGSVPRNGLAAFDTASSGTASSFNAQLNNDFVTAIAVTGTDVIVSGGFTTVNGGGTARHFMAGFDKNTAIATSFDPGPNYNVESMLVNGTTLYAGGNFTTFKGNTITRNRLAAFDTTGTGTPTAFNPNVRSVANPGADHVYALALRGTTLYVGGAFDTVNNSTTRNNLAAFNTVTGKRTAFDPNLNSGVYALTTNESSLYAGGVFTEVNDPINRDSFASFEPTNSYTLTYIAGTHGTISGTTPQTVDVEGNGTEVTAVPDSGYHFVDWSDSSTENPRTDSNIIADLTVTANFEADTHGGGGGGNSSNRVVGTILCKIGDKYNSQTGLPCTTYTPSTNVGPTAPTTCTLILTLRQGSKGAEVKCLQTKLNITSDGIFGPKTKAAVILFQKNHNLVPDGIVGPKTRGAL